MYLQGLIPEYQRDIYGRGKKIISPWFTNLTKVVMANYGWGLLVDKLVSAGITLQLKSGM